MIDFNCLHCAHPIQANDEDAGRKYICERCGHRAVVPGSETPPTDAQVLEAIMKDFPGTHAAKSARRLFFKLLG